MRGISPKTLDEVRAAVSAAGSGSGDLGTELFDVVATLDREPALRRVLTDPSTEAEAKAGLAEQIFGGKVSADVITVVRVAVSGRWASGRDLTDGLETAGVTALVAAADGKVTAPTVALVRQAAAARTASFEKVLAAFADEVADRRYRLLAEVRSTYPLTDAELDRIAAALAKRYDREFHLNTVIDPELVGGIAVSVGDEVVDGTMSTRLEVARRRLAG